MTDLFIMLWSSDSLALSVMENVLTNVHPLTGLVTKVHLLTTGLLTKVHPLTTGLQIVKETPLTTLNCIHH